MTAKFGLGLQAVSRFATLIWIPTGFSLAVLLLNGYRYWPAIIIGAFSVNLFTGAPPFVAVGIAIGNTLEAVIGVYLLKNYYGFMNSLSRLKDVLALIFVAAPFAGAVSATIGVLSLLLGNVIDSSKFWVTWLPWWVGDMISCFIVTPVILLWSQKINFHIIPQRILELLTLTALTVIMGIFVFKGFYGLPYGNYPVIYLVYPPIVWAALRFGQKEVAAIMLVYSGFAIWETMLGFGPFAGKNIIASLLSLQFFMIVTTATSLILSVVVSERKLLEERKDDFISMASHELRTPITSLKLYAELVNGRLKEKKFAESKKYLSKLNDQIYKLTSLVIDLLDVTRIQSGKLQIVKEPFNINLLIADIVEMLQRTTEIHVFIVKGRSRKIITGDKDRVYQVLVNLLTNAIKYSPDGGKIIIQCKDLKTKLQVSVKDSGVGIDKNHLQKIFEKLYRVPGKEKNIAQGLGIGLFVSSEIIKLHRGKIWAESKKGRGSTFYFTLPARVNSLR